MRQIVTRLLSACNSNTGPGWRPIGLRYCARPNCPHGQDFGTRAGGTHASCDGQPSVLIVDSGVSFSASRLGKLAAVLGEAPSYHVRWDNGRKVRRVRRDRDSATDYVPSIRGRADAVRNLFLRLHGPPRRRGLVWLDCEYLCSARLRAGPKYSGWPRHTPRPTGDEGRAAPDDARCVLVRSPAIG